MHKRPRRTIVAVLGLPISETGLFLLSQRNAPSNPATHKKWQFVGGGMEFGETPEQTLAREFQEEVSCAITMRHPHPIVRTSTWDNPRTSQYPDTHVLILTYLVSIGEQKVDFSRDIETLDARWFTLKQALALPVLPQTHEVLLEADKLHRMIQHARLNETVDLKPDIASETF